MSDLEKWAFEILKINGEQCEVIAQAGDLSVCKAAFEKALFVFPKDHLELRNGERIILRSKEESPETPSR